MTFRRTVAQLAGRAGAAAVGLPRFAHAQGAYKAEYKMSTGGAAGVRLGQGRRDLAHPGEGAHQGRINIKQYPGVSLVQGQQDREFSAHAPGRDRRALRRDRSTGPRTVKQLGVFTLPFLMPDYKACDAVIAERAR